MATNVTNDVQAGYRQLLRLPEGFETIYQGLDHDFPLIFAETFQGVDVQRDNRATGPAAAYANNLHAGCPVPLGATIYLWIPAAVGPDTSAPSLFRTTSYTYRLIWRLRDDAGRRADVEGNTGRIGNLHQPTVVGRIVQSGTGARQNAVPAGRFAGQDLVVDGSLLPTNRLPRQSAVLPWWEADGILGRAAFGSAGPNPAVQSLFTIFEVTALGDELLIEAQPTAAGGTWDFDGAGSDQPLSYVLGTNPSGTVGGQYGGPQERTLATGIYVISASGG